MSCFGTEPGVQLREPEIGYGSMAPPDVLWSEWLTTSALLLRIWVVENAGGPPLMIPVALASRAAPQAAQQQMLLDTLDTALVRSRAGCPSKRRAH